MSFFQNTRKPVGFGGRLMVKGMNSGSHAITIAENARILDAGCGGGANVMRLLAKFPKGHVTGLDYSEVSVAESEKVNQKAIADGRCEIIQGDVSALPFPAETFDLVTAFETVYFWPDPAKTFQGISRVLKTGGTFFICNESNGHDREAVKFSKIIDGMELYDAGQLCNLLHIETDAKGIWLCVRAVK